MAYRDGADRVHFGNVKQCKYIGTYIFKKNFIFKKTKILRNIKDTVNIKKIIHQYIIPKQVNTDTRAAGDDKNKKVYNL